MTKKRQVRFALFFGFLAVLNLATMVIAVIRDGSPYFALVAAFLCAFCSIAHAGEAVDR